jgi:hypothetical protein
MRVDGDAVRVDGAMRADGDNGKRKWTHERQAIGHTHGKASSEQARDSITALYKRIHETEPHAKHKPKGANPKMEESMVQSED